MAKQEMTCDHCRKAVAVSEIKYLPKGKDGMVALCPSCRTKFKATAEKKPAELKPAKKPYFCIRCKYHFKFDPRSAANLRCPFCGREDKVIEDKVPDADTLIRTLHDE